jgi:hypothetical protein
MAFNFCLAPLVALKQLSAKPIPGPRHRQIFDQAHRGEQIPFVVALAILIYRLLYHFCFCYRTIACRG